MAATGLAATLSSAQAAGDAGPARSSEQICRSVREVAIPDEPETGETAPCDAEALYYGIGRKADPEAARLCADRTARSGSSVDPFDGESLLMTIYANGRGAPRRLDVALALACRVGGAPAETEGRVLHLDRLRAENWTGSDFSVCDDATSGALAGLCAAHDERIADADRRRRLDAIATRLPPAARKTFGRLRRAGTAYAEAVGEHEVDQSGTARGAMAIRAQARQEDEFVALAEALDRKAPAGGGAAPFRAADARLNAVYGRVMATRDTSAWGTVKVEDIRRTQRRWIAYRDAFLAFARSIPADPDALAAALTDRRRAWLDEISG
ncbi:MAG: DUF1311 domain-containing protein [Methylobacterium frigidaeris]